MEIARNYGVRHLAAAFGAPAGWRAPYRHVTLESDGSQLFFDPLPYILGNRRTAAGSQSDTAGDWLRLSLQTSHKRKE